MSPTESGRRTAACTNVADCSRAKAGDELEWYAGPGEYCPECGEVLALRNPTEQPARNAPAPGAAPKSASDASRRPNGRAKPKRREPQPPLHSERAAEPADEPLLRPQPPDPAAVPRPPRTSRRWSYAVAAAFLIAGILGFVLQHRIAGLRPAGGDVAVCTVPLAKQLAGDLVKAYAQKSGTAPDHYDLIDGAGCDIILSTAAETPDAIIANDGIVAIVNPLNPVTRLSETQLREIFEGTIRDWSQLGGSPGPIVPILPEGSSAEAKALAATLFFNVALDANIRRAESSSAVTRFVTGAGRDSRGAIGLVTFSQTIPAKVVQLAYLPPPSVVSIASHRYPYTISISINAASNRADPAISGLVAFAKSDAGAAIVEASGFIPRKGL